jgi:hypothetical protein
MSVNISLQFQPLCTVILAGIPTISLGGGVPKLVNVKQNKGSVWKQDELETVTGSRLPAASEHF